MKKINLNELKRTNSRLFKHQEEAVKALKNYYNFEGDYTKQEGLLIAPTGAGKTYFTVNWLLNSCVSKGFKVIWLVHRTELIEQAYNTFVNQCELLRLYGINEFSIVAVSGEHSSVETSKDCMVNICSVGSLASKSGINHIADLIGKEGKDKLVVVIDEAHHSVAPTYRKVISVITQISPKRILLGVTATPKRSNNNETAELYTMYNVFKNRNKNIGDKGYITEISYNDLLINGFLAKPVYKKINTNIDVEIEYNLTEKDKEIILKHEKLTNSIKEKIAKSSVRNKIIVEEYIKNKELYGKTLIFALNKFHCKTLYRAFKDKGVKCEYCISGEGKTRDMIDRFKNKDVEVLINVQMLTEGNDIPGIKTVFLTRQTKSESLLMQMVGRGLRGPKVGGTEEVNIIDFYDEWSKISSWFSKNKLNFTKININRRKQYSKHIVKKYVNNNLVWDIYKKLYTGMNVDINVVLNKEVLPIGWFNVENNQVIIVYNNQSNIYKCLRNKIGKEKIRNVTIEEIIALFKKFNVKPAYNDIEVLVEYINKNNEMPVYFTFEEREELSLEKIANELKSLDMKRSEEQIWLKELYSTKPILQYLYKEFTEFQRCINISI